MTEHTAERRMSNMNMSNRKSYKKVDLSLIILVIHADINFS